MNVSNKKVFVTQIPHRTDSKTDSFVPAVNISTAAEFGNIEVLMPPRGGFYDTSGLRKQLIELLKDFDNDNDSLLPLGDPVLCAAVCAIIGRRFDYFDVLRWDKNLGRYTKQRVVV